MSYRAIISHHPVFHAYSIDRRGGADVVSRLASFTVPLAGVLPFSFVLLQRIS
jgi:hypothetical protein